MLSNTAQETWKLEFSIRLYENTSWAIETLNHWIGLNLSVLLGSSSILTFPFTPDTKWISIRLYETNVPEKKVGKINITSDVVMPHTHLELITDPFFCITLQKVNCKFQYSLLILHYFNQFWLIKLCME